MQQKVANLSFEEKQIQSERICTQLEEIIFSGKYQHIGLIVPLPNEPDIRPLIERCRIKKKTLYFPKIVGQEMHFVIADSRYEFVPDTLFEWKILVPQWSPHQSVLDLLLVPGLAFDASGGRMGKWGGWYDRYLEKHSRLKTVGICFHEQLIDAVPMEAHDKPVQQVIVG